MVYILIGIFLKKLIMSFVRKIKITSEMSKDILKRKREEKRKVYIPENSSEKGLAKIYSTPEGKFRLEDISLTLGYEEIIR